MATRRGWLTESDPAVQIGQRSAQERRVVNSVEGELPTYAVCRAYYNGRKNANPVLGPGKVITAHCVRLRCIAHVYEISVDEGCIPAPVFCGGVSKHDLRHLPTCLHTRQQGARLPRHGISLRCVSKREEFRNDVADVLRGLAKAQIELATHPTSNVRHD